MKKVSTTKLADEYLSVPAEVLWNALMSGGYIDAQKKITNTGIAAGGEAKSFKGITYIAWPVDFDPLNREVLGVKELGTKWGVSGQRINRLLNEKGFIEKATKGWAVTPLGKKLGGIQKVYTTTGASFVMWPDNLLENKQFKEIRSTLDNSDIVPEDEKVEDKGGNLKPQGRYKTKDGHFVRSRAEVIIDNWLFECRLPHAYERNLPIEENVVCDWYIPPFGANSSKPVYIEYWGLDTEKYQDRKKEKLAIYGRYPELNLIQLNEKDLDDIDNVLSRELTKVGINVSGF